MTSVDSQFYKWWISQTTDGETYINMSKDHELQEDQLPKGHTPQWIQAPFGTTKIEMMIRVTKIPELKSYNKNVVVLYEEKDRDVMISCKKLGWKYISNKNITGVEEQVVILLDTIVWPEYITRGINMLIIVTTKDR